VEAAGAAGERVAGNGQFASAFDLVGVFGKCEPSHVVAEHFIGAVAIDALGGGVPVDDAPIKVVLDDGIVGRLDDRLVVGEALFLGAPLGQVEGDCDDSRDRTIGAGQRGGGDLCHEVRAVLLPQQELAGKGIAGNEVGDVAIRCRALGIRQDEVADAAAEGLGGRVAEETLGRGVPVKDAAFGVDCVGRGIDAVEELGAESDIPFELEPGAEVAGDAVKAGRTAAAEDGTCRDLHRDAGAIGTDDLQGDEPRPVTVRR
jgi:hypothetical protein